MKKSGKSTMKKQKKSALRADFFMICNMLT